MLDFTTVGSVLGSKTKSSAQVTVFFLVEDISPMLCCMGLGQVKCK